MHDDYTPIWVKPGNTIKKYKHKWHGWNILSTAFKNNKQVLVFDEEFRNNKKFYYPNYEPAFVNACTYLYGKNEVAAQTLFYPYNTEQTIKLNFNGPIKQLITQASGLQFIEYLSNYGFDENTIVRFVDYNLFSLECMEQIINNWDGKNYLDFITKYVNTRDAFLKNKKQEWITLTGKEQKISIELWEKIKCIVKFEFSHQNLVLNKDLDVNEWLDPTPNTIINLGHIFNYDPNSPFVPMRHRIYNKKLLINKIKKYNPLANIIVTDHIEDIYKNTLPTWHNNGEWNEV